VSVVSWICPACETQNAYWRNYCEDCNHPARGYDPRPKPETDEQRRLRELAEEILKTPLPLPDPTRLPRDCHGFEPPRFDCGCPPYGTCMNTACPRAIRITTC
jgi:hypothetical protein